MLKSLGQRLRELRLNAGLSGRDLCALTDWLPSKVSKIENGRRPPSREDIRQWCFHCRMPEQIPDLIASLDAVDTLYVEWRRRERTGIARGLAGSRPLFERTKRFRGYNSWMIPGVLQTPAYATNVFSTMAKRRGVNDDSQDALKLRMKRQSFLRRPDRRFAVVLEESVLYNNVLSQELMNEQLLHLLVVAALPTVSLGVIPRSADRSTMWPVESFWIYDDARVHVELVSAWVTITTAHEIRMYAQVFSELAAIAVYGPMAKEIIQVAVRAQTGSS